MKLIAIAGVIAAALTVVGVSIANPPIHDQDNFSYSGVQDCGTFLIEFEGTVEVDLRTYVDAQGDPIRVQAHVTVSETDVNVVTGESIPVRAVFNDVYDIATGTYTRNGVVFISNQPGKGAVLQDTGRITFNPDGSVVIRGPHEVFETQAGIFCDALG